MSDNDNGVWAAGRWPATQTFGYGHDMRRVTLALAIITLLPALAAAQSDPEAAIAQMRELVLFARYPEAVQRARAYLDQDGLTAAQRNAGLEVLAMAFVADGEDGPARDVLALLYSRDPGHHLTDSDASPRVHAAFARAREAHPDQVEVTVRHTPPGTLSSRESPMIEVQVSGSIDAVTEIRLAYRTGSNTRYERVVMNVDADGSARARLPVVGAPDRAQRIDYYLEALAPSSHRLAELGSQAEPLSLTVPPADLGDAAPAPVLPSPTEPPPPTVDDEGGGLWWLAVVAGVLAIGGAVALAVTLPEDAPSGSLGAITLR